MIGSIERHKLHTYTYMRASVNESMHRSRDWVCDNEHSERIGEFQVVQGTFMG